MNELLNVKQLARNKQRSSFNKDKQHSRRVRGRGEAGRGRGGEAGRGGGRGGTGPSVDEGSDEDSDEDEQEDSSKFRRRPVVAQDRQFELNEPVDDDEIPKLDIDYLLNQPIKEIADAHFKFADENEWEFTGAPNAVIIIDCAKIAQKLKTLNISQRLDLDLSPFGEPPLEESDPLKINTALKYITIYPDLSTPSSLSPSSTQQKSTTPEDSFFDDILSPAPSSTSPLTPTPTLPTSTSTLSSTSSHSSASTISHASTPFSTLPPSEEKKEKKIGDVTKASVEDLEDWLDSVI